MKSFEAGELLEINPELFRKRLQQARELIRDFMTENCGVANPRNRCRCNKMIKQGTKRGIVRPQNLHFAGTNPELRNYKREIEELHSASAIYKSHPVYKVPGKLMEEIKAILSSDKFKIIR